jgi:hypothetical protein
VVEQVDQEALLGRRHAGEAHRSGEGDRSRDWSAIWGFFFRCGAEDERWWWWKSTVRERGGRRIYKLGGGGVTSPRWIYLVWVVHRDGPVSGAAEELTAVGSARGGDNPHAGRFIVGAQ